MVSYQETFKMCYTIEINLTREQLEKRFQATLDNHLPYRKQQRVSAFSLPECPVICADNPSEIRLYKWGLIPMWSRDEDYAREIRTKTFNAKAETITEKASFRHLIRTRKCLVLTNGFYEWQARGREKFPYYIKLQESEIFALAGLHDSWTNKSTGEILNTFTIITTQANPMMEKIHNTKKRMPAILSEEDEREWCNPQLPLEKTLSFLHPFNEKKMLAEEVDKALFRRKKEEEENRGLL
jgi:putative SOS response-associated peptidase YedK